MTDKHKFNRKNQRNAVRSLKKWDYLSWPDFLTEWGSQNTDWLLKQGYVSRVNGTNSRPIAICTPDALEAYNLA